jgi:hypothetical protein
MKYPYLILIVLMLTSCATGPTEYALGCRAGVNQVSEDLRVQGVHGTVNPEARDQKCDELSRAYQTEKRVERQSAGHGKP